MRIKYLFMFLVVLNCHFKALSITNDSIKVSGKYSNRTEIKNVTLYSYNSHYSIVTKKIINGEFTLFLSDKIEPGVYRLEFDKTFKVDIIIDSIEKEIEMYIDTGDSFFNPIFTKSLENMGWYKYLSKSNLEVLKLEKMFSFLSSYPKDRTNVLITRKYNRLRKKYYKCFLNFVKDNQNSWAGCLVQNQPFYFSNLTKPPIIRDYIRRDFYWEGIDTANPKLINSPLYYKQIDTYFQYINSTSHHTFSKTEKEYELKKSIDTVLTKFSNNEKTYQFAEKYIQQMLMLNYNTQIKDYISNQH
jgi:hypothetical protein